MGLTPVDIHNVRFGRPRIGRRGYSEEEVDALLDLVEGQLASNLEEIGDLRRQNADLMLQLSGIAPDSSRTPQRQDLLNAKEAELR